MKEDVVAVPKVISTTALVPGESVCFSFCLDLSEKLDETRLDDFPDCRGMSVGKTQASDELTFVREGLCLVDHGARVPGSSKAVRTPSVDAKH